MSRSIIKYTIASAQLKLPDSFLCWAILIQKTDEFNDSLAADIRKVQQVPIIKTILDVVCETTGMRFAAVARVTQDRWIACNVRDDIAFGLQPGGELKIETTLCNEIRDHHQPIVIDNVAEDEKYRNHHTPQFYGLQSYISYPIILKDGEFFGTLCAIDSVPASLRNPKVMGMFSLFCDLISYHMQSIDLIARSNFALHDMNTQLVDSLDENRQFHHISNHNLQEPLRKIKIFSNMLVDAAREKNIDKTVNLSMKVNACAQTASMMVSDLSAYAELNYNEAWFEQVDLNKIVSDVVQQLGTQIEGLNAVVNVGQLPGLLAIPLQMEQLFYHLISNSLRFSRDGISPVVTITSRPASSEESKDTLAESSGFEIRIEDNGKGIEKSQIDKIFNIFSQVPQTPEGFGFGLAYCRKIVRKHGGMMSAESEPGKGTSFLIVMPGANSSRGASGS